MVTDLSFIGSIIDSKIAAYNKELEEVRYSDMNLDRDVASSLRHKITALKDVRETIVNFIKEANELNG